MFSLPVLTERVSSIFLQRTRMRAILPLELVTVPSLKLNLVQETDRSTYRHAWLQARITTAGGWNYQKAPANLP